MPDGDVTAAREARRRKRRRAAARASYHRSKARGGTLTDEQRQAQRALVGFTNGAQVELATDSIIWWRDPALIDIIGSTTEEVSAWLTTLDVPHQVAVGRRRRGGRTITVSGAAVALADLDQLAAWAPSFVEKVRAALHRQGGSGTWS